MSVAAIDIDTGFGTDITLTDDLSPVWGLSSDDECLANAIYRKVTTPPGSLDEIDDPSYDSIDLRSYVNLKLNKAGVSNLKSRLSAVCENDPRVRRCIADVKFTFETMTMVVELQLLTAQGPFTLVLMATDVTVEILSINGQPTQAIGVAEPPPAQVIAVTGKDGAPGATGAAGVGGTQQGMLSFSGPSNEPREVASGAEEVIWQGLQRFGDLPGSLTAALAAEVSCQSGEATFRLRVGGGDMTADGTVVLSLTTSNPSFEIKTVSAAFTNPTGTLRVKVTAQNPVVGQPAAGKSGEVTFR
jgi:hypothetical protein